MAPHHVASGRHRRSGDQPMALAAQLPQLPFRAIGPAGLVEQLAVAIEHLVGADHQRLGMVARHRDRLELGQRCRHRFRPRAPGGELDLDRPLLDLGRDDARRDAGGVEHARPGGAGGRQHHFLHPLFGHGSTLGPPRRWL